MAEFRLKASTEYGATMRRWRRTASTASGPQPSHSSERTSSPLPHLCLRPPDQLILPQVVRLVTTPKTLYQPLLDSSIAGNGTMRRWPRTAPPPPFPAGLFDQPLPDSDEPILGAVLRVPYPVGHEVHLSPLLTRIDHMLAHLPVQRPPLVFSNLGHRTAKLHGHVNPYRKLDHPKPLVSPLGAVPATPADIPPCQTSASPSPPPQAVAPALRSARATADGPLVHCRLGTPNARSGRPPTSRACPVAPYGVVSGWYALYFL